MGRTKNEDKEKLHKDADRAKELLREVQATNGISVEDIINKVNEDNIPVPTIDGQGSTSITSPDYDEDEPEYVPTNTLAEIKAKFGLKKEVTDEKTGLKELVPVYTEDDQLKMLFGLLSERGVNVLDYLEKILQSTGYSSKVVFSINETLDKTTNILRDIADMQFKKQKLINESRNLGIQEFKANLKKEELEIKRMAVENAKGTTGSNIIAVASPTAILEALSQGGVKDANIEVIETKESETEEKK